jgi:hypothetical protein
LVKVLRVTAYLLSVFPTYIAAGCYDSVVRLLIWWSHWRVLACKRVGARPWEKEMLQRSRRESRTAIYLHLNKT